MKGITIGMILYRVVCAMVVFGIGLYQEIKHDRALQAPEDGHDSRPETVGVRAPASAKHSSHTQPRARRAA
jgi:hypothetical protein